MATDTGFGMVRFFDDFLVDIFNSDAWTIGTTGNGTSFIVNVQVNGVIKGIVTDNSSNDIEVIYGELLYQADDAGPLIFETRIKLITSLSQLVFVGFSDQKATERPIDYNGESLTTTATDAVGFYYAGGVSDTTWRCGGVANGTASTQTAASSDDNPVLGTYQTFRVVLDEDGAGSFYLNGKIVVENVSGCVRKGTSLMPFISITDDGAAAALDVDYVYVSKGRV